MADEDRRKLRLSRAKKGLVEGLTKLMHDAAGELVTDALMGLEESPRGRSASARSSSLAAGRTDTFRRVSPSRVCNGLMAAEGFQRGLSLQRSLRGSSTSLSETLTFRIDGTMVPECSINDLPWTVARYLKSIRKSAGQLKLGVGFYYKGSTNTKTTSRSSFQANVSRLSPISTDTSFTSAPCYNTRGRKRKLSHGKGHHVTVLYAPKLVAGLDDASVKSRVEVYRIENHLEEADHSNVLRDMDETIPFYPELVFYGVFSIEIDGKHILSYNSDGTFSVLQGSSSQGHFQVVHQSAPDLRLPEEERAVPLYCVASTHTILHKYQWENCGTALSCSSPVLWVNKAGVYKCIVKDAEESMECCSREISVSATFEDCKITRIDGPPSSSSQKTSTDSFVKGDAMIFSFDDLSSVTNNFSKDKIIGKGGFGKVYRGRLRHSEVAIKVLNTRGVQSIMRAESECLLNTEVAALTRYRHTNLIALMGYCRSKPILVYPYMQRESLFKNLHEWKITDPLTWVQRLSILTDTCRGLAYLHSEQSPVIHHDINSSNILLDEKLTAKLSDFGFSIQLPQTVGSKTMITSVDGLPGTDGYQPPEYSDRKFSVLSDMYSFGVVALECYTGLLAFSSTREGNNLVDHTEEDRANVEAFTLLSDTKLNTCPVGLLTPLIDVINQ